MRQSSMSVIFAAALMFQSYELSGALPMSKGDDASLEQDVFASLLSDKALDSGLGDADLGTDGKTSGQRVIVIATPSLWRDLRALSAGVPLYKRRADFSSQLSEHSDASQDLNLPIPVQRRDNMRCMVGRVYRPCWEV
uniref:pro-melanin-concentrating hormone, like n=1 Tax=Solea senegalensis TaxID=28829 RepID=UPI001CD8CF07|nr:pro-melanin-concentrating hormone, like [Solea senegalensis]